MHCSGSILGTMKLIKIKRGRRKQTTGGNWKFGYFYCKPSLQEITLEIIHTKTLHLNM